MGELAAAASGEETPVVALTAGVGSVAHDVHYAVLVLGLLGLAALLVPWPSSSSAADDDHARRVAALRAQLSAGGPRAAGTPATTTVLRPTLVPDAAASPVARVWHPLAVVSTVAAAGVHAAVGPAHWREGAVLGLFFAGAALAQVVGAALLALRPSATLLRVGVGGTSALVALWLASRTTGVPLVPAGREGVGGWDLACVLWEVVAVVAGSAALRRSREPLTEAILPWRRWHPTVRLMTAASVTMLLVLSAAGASS